MYSCFRSGADLYKPMVGYVVRDYLGRIEQYSMGVSRSSDLYRLDEKALIVGANVTGIAAFRLDHNDDSFVNPQFECVRWHHVRSHLSVCLSVSVCL